MDLVELCSDEVEGAGPHDWEEEGDDIKDEQDYDAIGLNTVTETVGCDH